MAYAILNTDGTTLLTLADKRIDQTTTSLTLVGKNYAGYGEYLNNNFIKLLASGASSTSNQPRNPLKGQLWYDTTAKRLKIFDESFKSVSGAIVSSSQPVDLIAGDIWFNPTTLQLYVVSSGSPHLVGPAYPQSAGSHGWIVPSITVKDIDDNDKKVSPLNNYNHTIGYMSTEKFDISTSTRYSYLTTATTSTVKGLTIFGDINYTGKSVDRYLTTEMDFNYVFNGSTGTDISRDNDFYAQNIKIIELLKNIFPVSELESGLVHCGDGSVSSELGVPVGSEAKVICKFSAPGLGGYQIRRFTAVPGITQWIPTPLSTTTTLTNVVSTVYKQNFYL